MVAPSTAAAAAGPSQATRSRDNLAVVAAQNAVSGGAVTRSHQALPTPPNSISPAFGPHSLKAQLRGRDAGKTKLEPVDSDLDLQDTDGNATDATDATEPPPRDTAEPERVTSAILAKHYLPDILLYQGPLAIRHIMGCLTTVVPDFAALPPAKARRLVVAALEARSGGGGGGGGGGEEGTAEEGNDSPVVFEKIGWGTWDARRRRGCHAGPRRSSPSREHASSPYARAVPIPKGGGGGWTREGRGGAEWPGRGASGKPVRSFGPSLSSSVGFSYGSYDSRLKVECETDNMSLDGSASRSCSDYERDSHVDDHDDGDDGGMTVDMDISMTDDPEDATDEEDWAAMGAAALREASYPGSVALPVTDGRGITRFSAAAAPAAGFGSCSVPARHVTAAGPLGPKLDNSHLAAPTSAQERAAIEALLSLGAA